LGRSSARLAFRIHLLASALAIAAPACLGAAGSGGKPGHGHPSSVYQRRAFESMHAHGGRYGFDRRHGQWSPQQISAGWFQRPYPYHLDYYRMRYGGSYAPYFGNLYGPPQVVTAPPYHGPYYGGYGYSNGFGVEAGYGAPVEYPTNGNGAVYEGPTLQPNGQTAAQPNGESLPAPSP
jgi:hypothetical protein